MRFKFRVWDKYRDGWLPTSDSSLHCFTDYYLSFDGKVVGFDGEISSPTGLILANLNTVKFKGKEVIPIKAKDRFIVQQCTGVSDKNGQAIYEGDIVNVNAMNRVIEWRSGGFYCTWSDYALNTCWFCGGGPVVVGNIFENPELIHKE